MSVSRNDPCPCGSGKKYKACHMAADQAGAQAERVLGPRAVALAEAQGVEAARRAPFWEADVVPLMGIVHDPGESGALALVAAGEVILVTDVLGRRPAGVQARARAVLDAVSAGARKTGVFPSRLHVRDEALADALRAEAEARGIVPACAPLPGLDVVLDDALTHIMQSPTGGAASQPDTWAETEAAPAVLAEFHAAAAAYHRAAPWHFLADADPLVLHFPGEAEPWTVSVMGSGGIHVGLALYSERADFEAMFQNDEADMDARVKEMRGITLSMSYDPATEVPRPMRREVASAGWELAGPDAYPSLLGVRVPGRRMTAALVQRTGMACRAVTAFVQAAPDAGPWRDPATGIRVDFLYDDEDEDDGAGTGLDELRLPWPRLAESHLVGPAGKNADPQAMLRDDWKVIAERESARHGRFLAWLTKQKLSQAAGDRLARTGRMWGEMLVEYGLPAESATEYDLRFFLYSYAADSARPSKVIARHLTRSLARIFAFYAKREGIEYPWAPAVLEELDTLAADAADVRDVLAELAPALALDVSMRALHPTGDVTGTRAGWSIVHDEEMARLGEELHRTWLAWHDELVRGGITNTDDVRDILTGRQRQWESTPHPRVGGRTPKQALMDAEKRVVERLAGEG
ncbi:MAG TPA: SEC-C domain-containing protein [Longimicrobium sp.]|nr:SEC-C domain-containing protein [Longimicrobium sp.]